jgi:thioredoxin-related protein
MKTVHFVILLMIASTHLSAQKAEKVKWLDLEEALKLNAVAPRNILIDTYTDWCGWCKKMDAETFDHPVIASYINKHFYAVKFDAESTKPVTFGTNRFENPGNGGARKTTHQFVSALGVTGYPTIVYFTGDLKFIGPVPGYQSAEQIEPLLHFIVEEKYTTVSFEEYQKTFTGELKKTANK